MVKRKLGSRLQLFSFLFMFLIVGSSGLAQDIIEIGGIPAVKGAIGFASKEMSTGLNDSLMMANEEGGINGKKIQYIVEETDYKVDESIEKFKKIFAEHHPVAIFGTSTGMGLALRKQITEHYKVLYTSSSFSGALADPEKSPSMFIPGPTYEEQMGLLLLHIARTKPYSKIALFYSDTEFGKDPIPYVRKRARMMRLEIVSEVVVPLGITDVTKQVKELKDSNPDYVIFQGFVLEPVPATIRECKKQGMTCKFMGTFWGATKLVLDQLGPLADGYLVVSPYSYWWSEDAPMIKKIRDYTAKHYPDVKYRDNYYMQGFTSGLLFVDVLRRADKAGQLNYDGIVNSLQSIKDLDTGGLTATLTIDNNRFPVARIWQANPAKGIYEPVSGWLTIR